MLHLIVSSPFAIVWGRETWGEVKRSGNAGLHWNGKSVSAFAERNGVKLIEFEAQLERDLPSEEVEWFDFEAKAFPNANGDGLDADPKLITLKVVDRNERRAEGRGKLTLGGTESDPLHTIPISGVGRFVHISGPTEWSFVSERRLCSSEEYMPYFVGRHYEGLSDHPTGAGLKSLVVSKENRVNVEPRSWVSW